MIGVLSDIHANYNALIVALRELADAGTDRYIVAGDIVGYGPHPNECIDVVSRLPGLVAVAGNHELLIQRRLDDSRLPGFVRQTIRWTRETLSRESADFIDALPERARRDALSIAHGSLEHPAAYTRYGHQARAQLKMLGQIEAGTSVLVLGHTHVPWVFHERFGTRAITPGAWMELDREGRQLVNPGSVGQSRVRESVPKVRFAQLDEGAWRIRYWAAEYDHSATRRALRELGQPDLVHLQPSWIEQQSMPIRAQLSRIRRGVTPQ